MKFLKRFFFGLQRDVRLFFFVVLLLEFYRLIFILIMADRMDEDTGALQVLTALWAGLRLSLKTAGVVALISFVFVTLGGLSPHLRLGIGILASLIFSTLFMMRFSYFSEFDSTFGAGLLQGMDDGLLSIIGKVLLDYGFIWRFPVALILTIICIAVLSRLLIIKTFPLPNFRSDFEKYLFVALNVIAIGLFGVFVSFGGSFSHAGGINLDNAAVTSDDFLNESILDDGQAIFRTLTMAKNMQAGEISGVDEEKIHESAEIISGKNLETATLAPYLERITAGARVAKPKHIFIIIGESWTQWTMLGKYADLKVSEGLKSIIAEPNAYYSRNFLPNSDSTADSVAGIITGLPDLNVRINYQPKSFEEIYVTAPAPVLKTLGYTVDFWYGGAPNWENLSKLALAQGFDNFYGYPDLNAHKQTNHGAKDESLFDAIEKHLPDEPPTVHVILTTTNQPPYNLDLQAEGYDLAATLAEIKKLPDVPDAESLAMELGHYWYMDKAAAKFIRSVSQNYPESLFIVTGSRTARIEPSTHPTIFESQSVPFVIYGAGVTKNILPPDAVGGHISIAPTIIDLIAPENFTYRSIAPSLFESSGVAFDRDSFVTKNTAGKIDTDAIEFLPHVASVDLHSVNLSEEIEAAKKFIGAARTAAWWILNRGLSFDADKN